ncbi:Ubiquitin-like protein ATG12 [Hondaea fermentalgiana]|uniref:Ubiquitin-like protein ATG12 n=1 Tax=Hondaea fermentalgiana TaxID=2315210 RepID=A0A2R5G2H1_9STRA|nr:Ubiquitin-like protein ATG12 [Hondaea fermentalgiana]|eukprot:GBG24735.1 Ubiquitin-like protein ATG12 [Hondaea fermentalgiana]
MEDGAVKVNLVPANAPVLRERVLTFKANARVYDLHRMLRERLKLETLVLIVETCFAPTLDQELGDLAKNFGRNGTLHITYGPQAVFG